MQTRTQILCEYVGGHVWSEPITTEDELGNKILVVACLQCPAVRPVETELNAQQSPVKLETE